MKICIPALAILLAAPGAGLAQDREAAQGKAIYQAKGCYQCHNGVGQGSPISGPAIARTRVSKEAFVAYLRTPGGEMPPYSAALLSDQEAAAVWTFLQSLPADRTAAEIPLLSEFLNGPKAR